MNTMVRIRVLILGLGVAAAVAVGTVACGDDDGDDGDGANARVVTVTLKEFEVLTDKDSAPSGDITFQATNTGPEDPHELVVVKTDLASGDLPTSADGAADEAGEGVELIGEIEEFAVGGEESATFDLAPGAYVLLCNVVEEEADGTTESHYKNGMHTEFTVE